ncbi:hypothetical protein ACFOLD_01400 [Kocuria carniphila]
MQILTYICSVIGRVTTRPYDDDQFRRAGNWSWSGEPVTHMGAHRS